MRVPAVSVSLYFLLKQSNSVLLSMSKKLIASNLEYNTEELQIEQKENPLTHSWQSFLRVQQE